jgi:phosphoribosyl 1,2-cyclic phosphodiesterase
VSGAYLRFRGVRGSHAVPAASHMGVGGNTSCVELRAADHLLICDAGTGIIPLGEDLMGGGTPREALVVVTHYHWDHICGLPFFQPAFDPAWRLCFFGPGRDAAQIRRRLSDQMRAPYFPVQTEHWMAATRYLDPNDGGLRHGPFRIHYDHVHHPGATYGYRIEVAGKTIVYVSDNECGFLSRSIEDRVHEFPDAERDHLRRIESEERARELALLQGADVLIHDAQYTPDQYRRKRGWGHSCFVDTVNLAIDAGVKALYLYHHDPSATDGALQRIQDEALAVIADRRSPLVCHLAQERLTVDLGSGGT